MSKNFENMGIYDLRNYARAIGVKSPTTLKRNELIEKINGIIEGVVPKSAVSKKGRPPRHKINDDYLYEMFVADNLFLESEELINSNANISSYAVSPEFSFCENVVNDNNILDFSGYYANYSADLGVVYYHGYMTKYSSENIFVNKSLFAETNLKEGDFVQGKAKYLSQKNIYVATEIEFVNDKTVSLSNERKDFEQIPANYPSVAINFDAVSNIFDFDIIRRAFPIAKGARVVINGLCESRKEKFLTNLFKALDLNNIVTTLVSSGDSPEDIYSFVSKFPKLKVVEQTSNLTTEQFIDKLELITKNNCNRVEFGQDTAIVFYNTKNLHKELCDGFILKNNVSELQANIMATNKLKGIFNLAKCDENASLTMIFIDCDDELLNLSNCKLIFKNQAYSNTDLYVDVENSRTKNIEKIFKNAGLLSKATEFLSDLKESNLYQKLENLLS